MGLWATGSSCGERSCRATRAGGHVGRSRHATAMGTRLGGRGGRGAVAGARRSAQLQGRARGPERARSDGGLSGCVAAPRRRLPASRAVRRPWRGDGARRARPSGAAAGDGVPGRRRDDCSAESRRDDRAPDSDCVHNRGEIAHQPPAARVRVLASGEHRVAPAASLEPDQSARLSAERAVVYALRRPDGASVAGRAVDRVGGAEALIRRRAAEPRGNAFRRPGTASSRRCLRSASSL